MLFFRVIKILIKLKPMTIDELIKVLISITISLLVLLPLLLFSFTFKELGSF